jgi:hypothetical protein
MQAFNMYNIQVMIVEMKREKTILNCDLKSHFWGEGK